MALEFEHTVKHGDIIILGTDGLFDNLDEQQIIDCLKPFLYEESNIKN